MPQSDFQCITNSGPTPNEPTAVPANSPDQHDRHHALLEAVYMSARMANMLRAAMALLRTISVEMADAGATDKPREARDTRDWARQINWIVEHVERDADQLRQAAEDAGFVVGASEGATS